MAEYSINPKSKIQNPKLDRMEQTNLDLSSTSTPSGPVECLGMTFPNDDERRKYFLEKLAEKLKDPEFRKIEGFPIGEDEDILALSDPPYYTACPNPWLADFVKHYGTAYNPKKRYHREPFAAAVSEGKTHPIYTAHSYHTKVPHRAIMRYILHYTDPGDLVFDGFGGTGMTGVAARLCGDRKEVQALGYRVQDDGTILNEQGLAFSKLQINLNLRLNLPPNIKPEDIPQQFQEIVQQMINQIAQNVQQLVQKEIVRQSPEVGIDIRVYGGRWEEYKKEGKT